MMKYTRRCDLREQNGKRSMVVKDITTVEEAVAVLQEIVAMQVKNDHFNLKMFILYVDTIISHIACQLNLSVLSVAVH